MMDLTQWQVEGSREGCFAVFFGGRGALQASANLADSADLEKDVELWQVAQEWETLE